jgi:steroid Delta-isomerase
MSEHADHVTRLVTFYETLSEQSLPQLRDLYTAGAYFKDPFNEVHSVAAIEKIFAHMFVASDKPRFIVHTKIVQDRAAFLAWDFKFHIRKFRPDVEQTIRGGSHVRFDTDGRVTFHRDYWDAAEELYEKFPIVGGLMRFLKKRVG